ncbi:MAG: mechanosensitive ion channel family protein, partial [Balneolaceae bacterium]
MQLRLWVFDVTEYRNIRNDVNQAIVRTFRENNIEIPFPQRDLHVRSSVPLPINSPEQEQK